MPPSSRPRLMLPAIEEAQKCLEIQHKGANSPPRTMLSLCAAHRLICSDSFLCPPVCADLVFFFTQALETLDNGKPYIISYLVDLDMVLKCLRYGRRLPAVGCGRASEGEGGVGAGEWVGSVAGGL